MGQIDILRFTYSDVGNEHRAVTWVEVGRPSDRVLAPERDVLPFSHILREPIWGKVDNKTVGKDAYIQEER